MTNMHEESMIYLLQKTSLPTRKLRDGLAAVKQWVSTALSLDPMTFIRKDLQSPDSGKDPCAAMCRKQAEQLLQALKGMELQPELDSAICGPSYNLFTLKADPQEIDRIREGTERLARTMGVRRISSSRDALRPELLQLYIAHEIPWKVSLREALESAKTQAQRVRMAVPVAMNPGKGFEFAGLPTPYAPEGSLNLMISGKNPDEVDSALHSVLLGLICRNTPEELRFIMYAADKNGALQMYEGLPHLLCPLITDAREAAHRLEWAHMEIISRYLRLAEAGAEDIGQYNESCANRNQTMPHIVFVLHDPNPLLKEIPIARDVYIRYLAHVGHKVGMHVVLTDHWEYALLAKTLFSPYMNCLAYASVSSDSSPDHVPDAQEYLLGQEDMICIRKNGDEAEFGLMQGLHASKEDVQAVVAYAKQHLQAVQPVYSTADDICDNVMYAFRFQREFNRENRWHTIFKSDMLGYGRYKAAPRLLNALEAMADAISREREDPVNVCDEPDPICPADLADFMQRHGHKPLNLVQRFGNASRSFQEKYISNPDDTSEHLPLGSRRKLNVPQRLSNALWAFLQK